MPESEETKPVQEQEPSLVAKGLTPSLEDLTPVLEAEPVQEEAPPSSVLKEVSPEISLPKKVELKKHSPLGSHPSSVSVAPAAPVAEQALINSNKEVAANAPQVEIEVEIDFILDRKRIPLMELSTLAEGEMMTLSGTDFKATLFLQEKAIAEAQLVMVDQRPSIQITKILSAS